MLSYEEYHPFGTSAYRSTRTGANAPPKRYRFSGKERDAAHGLAYHGMRYYMTWTGRWTSADPAGGVDGPNLYAYARNNPVRLVDLTGTYGHETSGGENPPRTSGGENPKDIDIIAGRSQPKSIKNFTEGTHIHVNRGTQPPAEEESPEVEPSEKPSANEIVFRSFFDLPSASQLMMSGVPPGMTEYARRQPKFFTPNLPQDRPGGGAAGAAILKHQSRRMASQVQQTGEQVLWYTQQVVGAINAAQGAFTPSLRRPIARMAMPRAERYSLQSGSGRSTSGAMTRLGQGTKRGIIGRSLWILVDITDTEEGTGEPSHYLWKSQQRQLLEAKGVRERTPSGSIDPPGNHGSRSAGSGSSSSHRGQGRRRQPNELKRK